MPPSTDKLEVYGDDDSGWNWKRVAGNNKTISDSKDFGESFTREEDAWRGAYRANPDLKAEVQEAQAQSGPTEEAGSGSGDVAGAVGGGTGGAAPAAGTGGTAGGGGTASPATGAPATGGGNSYGIGPGTGPAVGPGSGTP